MQDRALISRFVRGDTEAFETIYKQYHNKVYAVALGMVKNEEDALDVCQDVFVKAYKNAYRMKGDSSIYTWIYRITVNVCLDRLRKSSRTGHAVSIDEPVFAETLAGSVGMPEEELLKKADAKKVRDALYLLPPDMRAVLILREFEGLSYEEIAQVTGSALGTVKSKISRAREKLRKIFLKM